MTITLYDLYSNAPGTAWSPSVWKIRYCLNFKGLDHKTEWVEFPDLESLYQKHGIKPTVKNADGSPRCSVPVIYDPSTNVYLTDSVVIAQYLDKTYPQHPIFPHNTIAIQSLLESVYIGHIKALVSFVMPATCAKLNPVSEAYYRPKRVETFGKPADGVPEEIRWAQYKDGLGKVDEWYSKTDGPFLMGNTVSWGDFVVAACLIWPRVILGEDSREWHDITSWHGGRWARLINELRKYETVR